MKTGRNGGKKIGMKSRNLLPSNYLQFKPRKIPEKPRGRRREEGSDCGKERRRDAANLNEVEAQK